MFYQKNNMTLVLLIYSALLLPVQKVMAIQDSPDSEIVDIKANNMMLNEQKGIGNYRGNVVFTKGSLIVKADSITVFYKNNKLHRAIITGKPADVRHKPKAEPEVHSQADKMEYFIPQERMILLGNAFIKQGNRQFTGQRIEYDTRQNIIKAQGGNNSTLPLANEKQQNDRIHVIIGPETK